MARAVLALSHAKPSYGVLYHIKLCVKVEGFTFYYSFEGEGKTPPRFQNVYISANSISNEEIL